METHSKFWYLENFNFRTVLTMEERERIAGTAVMRYVSRKEILYFPTEPCDSIYILKEGKVKIYRKAPDGKEIILNIIHPGELFGELGIAGQQEREEVAEVLQDSVICTITLKDMQELMKCMPSLNAEILIRLSNQLKKVQNRLESLICKNAQQRIRSLLKEVALDYGRIIAGDPGQIEVKLGLTHAEIAKLTGTCRQSVSSVLCELEKLGIIKYDRRRIYIRNLSML